MHIDVSFSVIDLSVKKYKFPCLHSQSIEIFRNLLITQKNIKICRVVLKKSDFYTLMNFYYKGGKNRPAHSFPPPPSLTNFDVSASKALIY